MDNSVVKMLQDQVKKLQEEMASVKAELKSVKETAKKNDQRVTVLESLVQEETDEEEKRNKTFCLEIRGPFQREAFSFPENPRIAL